MSFREHNLVLKYLSVHNVPIERNHFENQLVQ